MTATGDNLIKILISQNSKARSGTLLSGAKDTTFQGARDDGDWEAERLGGWKMTTTLKHANATGWNRKDAKAVNNRAADPTENQTREHYLPSRPGFPRRSLIYDNKEKQKEKEYLVSTKRTFQLKNSRLCQNHPHPAKGETERKSRTRH